MTFHNITGSERSGPHVIIRRVPQVRRQTIGGQILKAIGGTTVLATLTMVALFWSGVA